MAFKLGHYRKSRALGIAGKRRQVEREMKLVVELCEKAPGRFPFIGLVPVIDRLAFASPLTVGGLFLALEQ